MSCTNKNHIDPTHNPLILQAGFPLCARHQDANTHIDGCNRIRNDINVIQFHWLARISSPVSPRLNSIPTLIRSQASIRDFNFLRVLCYLWWDDNTVPGGILRFILSLDRILYKVEATMYDLQPVYLSVNITT